MVFVFINNLNVRKGENLLFFGFNYKFEMKIFQKKYVI